MKQTLDVINFKAVYAYFLSKICLEKVSKVRVKEREFF